MSVSFIRGPHGMGMLVAATLAMAAPDLHAQTAASPAANATDEELQDLARNLNEIIVTGTRQDGLRAADSPAPIQILSRDALEKVASSPDLMSTLSQVVPSLTMETYGFDMGATTLMARLRGLSPNDVLVLVNGKRRHTSSNIEIDRSAYQGGANVDLNFIPIDAIDHIEVLTDGAAAQYGSDAIAGVINIILKKDNSGGKIDGTYGNYFNGGGNTGDVSANAGFQPVENSYLNVTASILNRGPSNVGAVDPRLLTTTNLTTYPNSNITQLSGYPYLNQIDGDPETHTKLISFNAGLQLGADTQLYAFGTYGDKHAAAYENYRVPNKIVYKGPADAADPTGTTEYPFPFGFSPQEATHELDYQLTGGIKGVLAGWNWDLAIAYGGDKVDQYTQNSTNSALYSGGVLSLQDLYDGYLKTTQWTSTIDINRDFDVGLAGPLNVAYGAEYRRETYGIGAGIPASYLFGSAQGYEGFTAADAGVNHRKDTALYLDLATKPLQGLRVDLAGRYEHYSDFGNATIGKLTTRYDFDPKFAIRGTASTGFRAPTIAEEFYSNTVVSTSSQRVQMAPDSVGGKMLGLGNGLQAEKSTDYSLGFVWYPLPRMSATLDLYQITITNRIVASGNLSGTVNGQVVNPIVNAAIAADGTQIDPTIPTTSVALFTNGVDTRTRGVDLQFDFPFHYSLGLIDYSIGATFNETSVTSIRSTPAQLGGTPLFDPTAISDITTASPKFVINLGATWTIDKVSIALLEKIYGPSSEWRNDDGDNNLSTNGTCNSSAGLPNLNGFCYYNDTIGMTPITNLDISYEIHKGLKLGIGANNLFNRYSPKLNSQLLAAYTAHTDNTGVVQYPQFSPFGIDGGFYYAKVTYSY